MARACARSKLPPASAFRPADSSIRIGTAGWAIPRACANEFPRDGTHLERYARVFNATEINSSFYRPHRKSTYERWAASVPDGFAFSVKIPKLISHEKRCVDCGMEFEAFLEESAGLGSRRRLLLLQLPPSFAFDAPTMERFFAQCVYAGAPTIVCEPRHPSWFTLECGAALASWKVPRVGADPPRAPGAELPGGWPGVQYLRLHGSPRIYYSSYDDDALRQIADRMRGAQGERWCIFDNTASGAAAADALRLLGRVDWQGAGANFFDA